MKLLHNTAAALCCSLLLTAMPVLAVEYALPAANSRLIGENQEYVVPADNRPLEQIASDFQLGLTNIMEANPGVDPYLPTPGSKLIIPHQLILPNAPREGIVINVAEMRLYYYPKGKNVVHVLPIGIGHHLGRVVVHAHPHLARMGGSQQQGQQRREQPPARCRRPPADRRRGDQRFESFQRGHWVFLGRWAFRCSRSCSIISVWVFKASSGTPSFCARRCQRAWRA